MAVLYYESQICHHGIKGQRWGIRRFQDRNGRLTVAGKKRYGNLYDKRSSSSKLEPFLKKVPSDVNLLYDMLGDSSREPIGVPYYNTAHIYDKLYKQKKLHRDDPSIDKAFSALSQYRVFRAARDDIKWFKDLDSDSDPQKITNSYLDMLKSTSWTDNIPASKQDEELRKAIEYDRSLFKKADTYLKSIGLSGSQISDNELESMFEDALNQMLKTSRK